MFEALLPAIEKGILEASGFIPIVFEGIERCLQSSASPDVLPSRHTSHELFYLREGRVSFHFHNELVSLDKGSSIIMRPQTFHTVRPAFGRADTVSLYFGFAPDPDAIKNAMDRRRQHPTAQHATGPSVELDQHAVSQKTLESFFDFVRGEDETVQSQYLLISGKNRQEVGFLVERIMRENREEAIGNDLMIQLLTMELLIMLSRILRHEWEESLCLKHGKARELVFIAKDYIDRNYHRQITVADAASFVFLSQGYFTREFKSEIGQSPQYYLMNVRMKQARIRLLQPEIKINAVAREVGFSSPQRFNAAFKKYVGMTPMQYRKMIEKKENSDGRISPATEEQ